MDRSIHKAITERAAALNHLSQAQINALTLGAGQADSQGWGEDWHFDGRKNFAEVQAGWKKINDRVIGRGDDYHALGFDVHNTQDFYAHSNYLELFVQYYIENIGDMSKFSTDIVPLYEEGIKIQVFKEQYLGPKLKSGEFHLHSNEMVPWTDKDTLDEHSHYHMNKDSEHSLQGREVIPGTNIKFATLGVEVAVRATRMILLIKRNSKQTIFLRGEDPNDYNNWNRFD